MCAVATRQRFSGQGPRLYVKPGLIDPWERPAAVTAIGLVQLAKAALLLGVVFLGRFFPESLRGIPVLPQLLFVAAHGRDTHGILMPVIGGFTAIVGIGLLRLRPWARRSLIASTGLMMAIWVQRFYVDWVNHHETLRTPVERQAVWFLLFLDAAIFIYLVFYNDIPRAFSVEDH